MDMNISVLEKLLDPKKVKKILEIPVSMDYPSKKITTKIRPILDWYIIAKYWIKGIFDKSELKVFNSKCFRILLKGNYKFQNTSMLFFSI